MIYLDYIYSLSLFQLHHIFSCRVSSHCGKRVSFVVCSQDRVLVLGFDIFSLRRSEIPCYRTPYPCPWSRKRQSNACRFLSRWESHLVG
jgi:hypothetical protein